jgi:hypothetical protein
MQREQRAIKRRDNQPYKAAPSKIILAELHLALEIEVEEMSGSLSFSENTFNNNYNPN